MREGVSWIIMFIAGTLLIIIGFEGSLGKILACVTDPQLIQVE